MQILRERFRTTIGQSLDHDGSIIIARGFDLLRELIAAVAAP
jgi:hypothetical protein